MAGITTLPNGRYAIDFSDSSGKRQRVRIGKVPKRYAEEFRRRIEELIHAGRAKQAPPLSCSDWVAKLPFDLREKLVKFGLVRTRSAHTLGELVGVLWENFTGGESTRENISIATNNLLRYFGESRPIDQVTKGDAKAYKDWLIAKGSRTGGVLAESTVSRRLGRAQELFKIATDHGWLTINPFHGLKKGKQENRERDFFVDRELFARVLDKCPDAEFRAILGLMRFAGLRFAEVHQSFNYSWVDWSANRMAVDSIKTGTRQVPISGELRQLLNEHYDSIDAGGPTWPRHQVTRTALSQKLERVCKKLGMFLWPKPFQNLRASCETEWLNTFPLHTVASWMGHSPKIALRHYAQVPPEHWQRASGTFLANPDETPKSAPFSASPKSDAY